MISSDIYGKTLSNTFTSAITSYAQKVKPKIVIQWLDSRHVDSLTATTNSSHASNSVGDLGYYFSPIDGMSGKDRQSFTWGVCDAKDVDGKVITANGQWYTVPSNLDDGYKYGWWSGSVSSSSASNTYTGYGFATDPYAEWQFTQRKVNRIRIATSEYYGRISDYTLYVYNQSLTLILQEDGSIADGEYFRDHNVSASLASQDVYKIKVVVHSTVNPQDYARLQEVSPIYETDISDYVINHSVERTRDLHETSLPIAGSGSSSASISLDNSTKIFNPFNQSSDYGKYMKKDLKITIANGWRIKKTENILSNTILKANIAANSSTLTVEDTNIFPDGGDVGTYYTVFVDKDTQSEEMLLISQKTSDKILQIAERGYNNTTAKGHTVGAVVTFDPYEYVHAGTFYVDEWSGGSSMQVSIKCNDWSKYLSEKQITLGYFEESVTAGDAIRSLLLSCHFPQADYDQLVRHTDEPRRIGGIAQYSFNEPTIDRSSNQIVPSSGLRARFWAMPTGKESLVKDILGDAIDRQLSELEKALGQKSFVAPDYVALSKSISSPTTSALELSDYSFTSYGGELIDSYYNGIIDGFYVPSESGVQEIFLRIKNGGTRLYLDDNLIINEWFDHPGSLTDVSSSISQNLDLDAGKPYKIRIEFFYTTNNFSLELWGNTGGSDFIIDADDCYTICAFDSLGANDASPLIANKNCNHHRNYGVYVSSPKLGQTTGLVSEVDNKSVLLENNAYIRIPYSNALNIVNSSSNTYTGDWTIEIYAKLPTVFSSDGEYISNWANSNPTAGFEFFNNSSGHGFKLKTSGGTKTVSSDIALSTSEFSHIVVVKDGSSLKYYINGQHLDTEGSVHNINSWANLDITIGGRGASYVEYTNPSTPYGETMSSTKRSFTIDEFTIYNKALTGDQILNRYITTKIQPLTVFPFFYGNDTSVRDIIDTVSLADFGRMYIDELDRARYDHFYRFFESSIPQHSQVQQSLSGNTNIISGDYNVQLITNKVTVNVSGLASSLQGRQGLWNAPDPTTLGVVTLAANLTSNSNTVIVNTTDDPPFSKNGYLKIDNEIVKYTSINSTSFLGVERSQFNTTATTHNANTKVREVKYFDAKFDKAPAFNIQLPFISAIQYEDPNLVEIHSFKPTSYGAELIIVASNSVSSGEFVFLQGTNPLTGEVQLTSIAGTPIVTTEQAAQVRKQSSSLASDVKKYGLKEIIIDNSYITDALHATKIADFFISKLSEPVPILTISSIALPTIQLGDRVKITSLDTMDISNTDYWVVGHSLNVGDSLDHSVTLRKVM